MRRAHPLFTGSTMLLEKERMRKTINSHMANIIAGGEKRWEEGAGCCREVLPAILFLEFSGEIREYER